MKCIITGAAGFIGSHLVEKVLNEGHDVVGIDCFTDYYPRPFKEKNLQTARASPRFEFIEQDIVKADLTGFFSGVDTVFHLAAQAGVRSSWGREFRIYSDLNVLGTQRVLEAAVNTGVKRVVYASSSSIYGDAERYPTPETSQPCPISPYGVTKLAGEHLCRLYKRGFGLSAVSLRYFTVYGPRQRPDMAFHIFGRALLQGCVPVVFGTGEQTRDFTYVGDAVEATYNAGIKTDIEGDVFNIGGGSRNTLNRAVQILCELAGRPFEIERSAVQKGDVRHTCADIERAASVLGYKPGVPLEIGLTGEFEWLKDIYGNPLKEN
ncbi:NAD-dependent epimerase/dehydratase family protein [bacterium]|nr:NAD-dependent epimerase/dehydratase family protein [candidate division CSSED10-310 bacterium]